MKDVQVRVGTVRALNNGHVQDERRTVTFTAERLGERHVYTGTDDTRGVTETLFKTDDGRYIVYVEDWSRWRGEPCYYSLHEAADDLDVGGQFEALGREAGLARALTLDEALEPHHADDS